MTHHDPRDLTTRSTQRALHRARQQTRTLPSADTSLLNALTQVEVCSADPEKSFHPTG
jgi:hypothetical protein